MSRERLAQRIPLADRLLRPGTCRRAISLAQASDVAAAERALEARAADRATRMVRTRLIGWAVERQERWVHRVREGRAWEARHPGRTYRTGSGRRGPGDQAHGDLVDAAGAAAAQRRARERIDRDTEAGLTVHLTHYGRVSLGVAVAMLAADALALLAVFAFLLNLNWAAPDPADLLTAVALALFGAGVQAEIAVVLGDRLWARRNAAAAAGRDDPPGEEDPAPGPVIGVLAVALLVLGTLAALAVRARIIAEGALADAAAVAEPLGLVIAAAMVAAPWAIVAHRAFGASAGCRREAGLAQVVSDHQAAWFRERRDRDRAARAAARWAGRVQRWSDREVARSARPYRPAHAAILLARSLGPGRPADPPRPVDRWLPVTAVPVGVAPDLRQLAALAERSAELAVELRPRGEPSLRRDVGLAA